MTMKTMEIKNLNKTYPAFALKNVTFSLEQGKITGFIGRNGAGKTTTLKSLLNFVHPDSGEIYFFDKEFSANEMEIKKRIGYVSGGVNFYPNKKIKSITNVTKSFYENWDDNAYNKYMSTFKLDENKTPKQLSEGMKVKYALTLALSHNAELLILDEPTSGLDPVSRDELLDTFMELCDSGKTIMFSTHITSDLDKCADNIVYIKNGEIIAENELKSFVSSYKVVNFADKEIDANINDKLIGLKRAKDGYSALIKTKDTDILNTSFADADLEEIMIHFEKEGE